MVMRGAGAVHRVVASCWVTMEPIERVLANNYIPVRERSQYEKQSCAVTSLPNERAEQSHSRDVSTADLRPDLAVM
ncbi:hypothetical protein J6590_032731 [Homalodisca vitripennis]|nr:hypothetical protein J6590_032731 [Homalodisca vitripennis]